jgi:hypothetical protein
MTRTIDQEHGIAANAIGMIAQRRLQMRQPASSSPSTRTRS